MPVYLPQIQQPEHCKLWLQPGLGLVGLDHGANYPYSPELWDLSGNGNHCTMYNQAKNEASGYRYDAASGLWMLALDGVDDWVQTNADSSNAGVHVYRWWMRSDSQADIRLFDHGDENRGSLLLRSTSHLLRMGANNYKVWSADTKHNDGQWHLWQLYIAGNGQNDIDNAVLSCDGTAYQSTSTVKTDVAAAWTTGIRIGRRSSSYGQFNLAALTVLNYLPTDADLQQAVAQGPYWPKWEERSTVTTHCLPVVTAVDRAGRGARSVTAVAGTIVSSVDRVGRGVRTVTASIKPIATSVSRIGRGVRTVTAYCGRVVSSVTLGAPPIRMLWEAAISLQARYTATLHKSAAYTAIINKIAALTAVLRGVKRR